MEDLINEEILENISENYQIYKVTSKCIPTKYVIRERSCFADQDLKLVRHNNMSFFPTLEDANQALSEIVHQRFEDQAQ
jgi:acyl-CoA synthetase (NDP forming)